MDSLPRSLATFGVSIDTFGFRRYFFSSAVSTTPCALGAFSFELPWSSFAFISRAFFFCERRRECQKNRNNGTWKLLVNNATAHWTLVKQRRAHKLQTGLKRKAGIHCMQQKRRLNSYKVIETISLVRVATHTLGSTDLWQWEHCSIEVSGRLREQHPQH